MGKSFTLKQNSRPCGFQLTWPQLYTYRASFMKHFCVNRLNVLCSNLCKLLTLHFDALCTIIIFHKFFFFTVTLWVIGSTCHCHFTQRSNHSGGGGTNTTPTDWTTMEKLILLVSAFLYKWAGIMLIMNDTRTLFTNVWNSLIHTRLTTESVVHKALVNPEEVHFTRKLLIYLRKFHEWGP